MGTQSLEFSNNQVHLVELNEETGNLKTQVFQHQIGEIWSLQASPVEPDIFITCYNSLSGKYHICIFDFLSGNNFFFCSYVQIKTQIKFS